MAEAGPNPIFPLDGATTSVFPSFGVDTYPGGIIYRMQLYEDGTLIAQPTLDPQSRSWKCTTRLRPNYAYTWIPQYFSDAWHGATPHNFTTDSGLKPTPETSTVETKEVLPDGRSKRVRSKVTIYTPITFEES